MSPLMEPGLLFLPRCIKPQSLVVLVFPWCACTDFVEAALHLH